MNNLASALKQLEFESSFTRLDSFDLLESLSLPQTDSLVVTPNQLQKIQARDESIIRFLTQLYHIQWKSQIVTISPQHWNDSTKPIVTRGDANVFKALETYDPRQHVLVQKTPQPAFSGVITSCNPETSNKHQYCISTTNGAWEEGHESAYTYLLWDIRTHQVVDTQKPDTALTGIRRTEGINMIRSNNDEQIPPRHVIANLVTATQQTTQKIFSPLHLKWEYTQGKLYFTAIRKIDLHSMTCSPSSSIHNSNDLLTKIATGQTICGGIVRGNVPKDILLVKTITAQHLPQLKTVSGIISYSPIRDVTVLSFLKRHHIPCIANVHPTIKNQNVKQPITLDASKGGVYLHKKTSPILHTPSQSQSIVKVYQWQKNPFYTGKLTTYTQTSRYSHSPNSQTQQQNTESVFSYDFLLRLKGVHPRHQLKKDPLSFTQNIMSALKTTHLQSGLAGYQTSDIPTADLSNMQYGSVYSSTYADNEKNPSYGERGGLHILHDNSLFKSELTALALTSKEIGKDVPCIVPFIRTVPELVWTSQLMEDINHTNKTNIPLFLRVDLPSQIHQLQYFLRPSVKGLVINIPQLHTIAYGLDPENHDLLHHYPLDKSLVRQYLAQITSHVTSTVPVWMIVDTANEHIIEDAYNWGIRAIITKSSKVAMYQKTLASIENTTS